MNSKNITHYREYLQRYVETTKQRRPGFSLTGWAKTLGLKSTSSLTKVLNGEREAGSELIQKLVHYFKFNTLEEAQFRNLVTLSKLKENSERKTQLAESLLQSQSLKELSVRFLEFDQFQLLSSYLPLAVRELTRLPKMKIATIAQMIPQASEVEIQEAMHLLSKMNLVKRDAHGCFVATDANLSTEHEISSEAIQSYHESSLDLAQESLKNDSVADRDFQSLVALLNSKNIPQLKEKLRRFMDTLEFDLNSESVDQLYQVQLQLIPVSKRFEETKNPNTQSTKDTSHEN